MLRTRALFRTALLSWLLLAASPPANGDVERLLQDHTTREQLRHAVRRVPDRCYEVSGKQQLCQWSFSSRDAMWQRLADAIDTDDRVNLLCEVPVDSGERAPGSCRGYAARSNRGKYEVLKGSRARRRRSAHRKRPNWIKATAEKRAQAYAEIEAAGDLRALSTLIGALPHGCEASGEHQLCTWKTSSRTPGHGTVAALMGKLRRKVRLICELPLDGSQRAAGSCHAEEGS